MLKVWQIKNNVGVRTSIESEEFRIELIDDKVLEFKDLRKRLQPVSWEWKKDVLQEVIFKFQ